MKDVAIRIEGLGKRYRYGGVAPLSANLRADIMDWIKGVFHRVHNRPRSLREIHAQHLASDASYFWALENINLEIKQGEVVGIIGRNGAGKSTLLKILARITPPTTGRVIYRGRVASLLEVGTGFHREFTGRENIYLNGSILGMRRAEIARKLDEIVAFAEVDKFLDTPVKFYSSGMYVRLAFAVAAHLDADIMLVDEVLAVGDAAFQQKCLGKMNAVAKSGRTVIFVSHNMGMIQTLCDRGIFLEGGKIRADTTAAEAARQYLSSFEEQSAIPLAERTDRRGTGESRLVEVKWFTEDQALPVSGQALTLHFRVSRLLPMMACMFTIYNSQGQALAFFTSEDGNHVESDHQSPAEFVCRIDSLCLLPGTYKISVALYAGRRLVDHIEGACTLEVYQGVVCGIPTIRRGSGDIIFPHRWFVPRM